MEKMPLDEKIAKMMAYKKDYNIQIGPSGEEIHIKWFRHSYKNSGHLTSTKQACNIEGVNDYFTDDNSSLD